MYIINASLNFLTEVFLFCSLWEESITVVSDCAATLDLHWLVVFCKQFEFGCVALYLSWVSILLALTVPESSSNVNCEGQVCFLLDVFIFK